MASIKATDMLIQHGSPLPLSGKQASPIPCHMIDWIELCLLKDPISFNTSKTKDPIFPFASPSTTFSTSSFFFANLELFSAAQPSSVVNPPAEFDSAENPPVFHHLSLASPPLHEIYHISETLLLKHLPVSIPILPLS
ncbi:hypothetical protein M0R45_018400 [Rubus argutus]|uniref:Uncharacterized protein n=1 Tax=Rubus argutus TaxID=59490 RepID=A0AAW1X431_RUBAR